MSSRPVIEKQQIVVMKGWEGFADRLQMLSHCLHYCKVNNAALCVDWRDYMWGQVDMDFSDYFEIIGIPVVSLANVLERVVSGASVLPPAFDKDSLAAEPNESIHFPVHVSPMVTSVAVTSVALTKVALTKVAAEQNAIHKKDINDFF